MRGHPRTLLPTLFLPLLLLSLCLPAPSRAASPFSSKNIQLTASTGYLGLKQYGAAGPVDQDVDLSGGVLLSFHPSAAIAANLDHGLPTRGGAHVNIARLSGQLRLYPAIGQPPGNDHLFLSAGLMWIGEKSVQDWSGANTQLTASHSFNDYLFAYGSYAHGFAWNPGSGSDRDFLRVGLGIGSPLGR